VGLRRVRRRLAERIRAAISPTAWVVDTGFPRDGRWSVEVLAWRFARLALMGPVRLQLAAP
jgi:hypothetical protein